MKTKFGMQALGLLLVLALVGAVFVPAVSAVDIESVEKYYVTTEDSYLIAKQTFDEFISSGALDNELFSDSQLSKEPMIIYDSNGLVLFHQYDITKKGKNLGFIRAAGSKVLGSPVIMIQETPDTINYQDAISKSRELMRSTFREAEYSEPVLVCYSYPKMGIMYEIIKKDGETEKVIIDAAGMFIVPNAYPKNSGDAGVWSLYDEIPSSQIAYRVNQWDEETAAIELASYAQKTKSFHYKKLWTSLNLEPQIRGNWCAVASAKMIAYWYGTSHSLEHIADVMGAWNYSYNPPLDKGVNVPQQETYYEVSSQGLQMNSDYYYTAGDNERWWSNIMDHIENSDVLTSDVIRHTRACDGYGYYDSGSRYLHIFDPGVPDIDTGSYYWESLTGVSRIGYLFIN